MAALANLTATPIPAGLTNGGVSGNAMMMHVTVAPASGAGTYTFTHGLTYTPLFAMVIAQLTEGTTPTAANSSVGFCVADTTSSVLGINVGGNGTYHVYYC